MSKVKQNGSSPHPYGFTVVELLAVISIIALLTAILQPAIVSAKRAAIRESCQSNMRSIGAAIHLYVADYDDRYPSAVDMGPKENPEQIPIPHPPIGEIPFITDVLLPFAGGSKQIFKCPSDVNPYSFLSEGIGPYGTWPTFFDFNHSSYGFWARSYFGKSASKDDQSSLILAQDAMTSWHCPYENPGIWIPSRNYLYGDGHVKFGTGMD